MTELGKDYFGFPNQSEAYDNFRPSYPQQIVDEIIAVCCRKVANWNEESILLSGTVSQNLCGKTLTDMCAIDIGCGTGLFTRMIAPYFGKVIGVDTSEKQLKTARHVNQSTNGFKNVTYLNYDAYDLEPMLEECGVSPSDVCLVTVAEALHWLDIPRLLDVITNLFPRGSVFAPVAYLFPPEIMNNQVSTTKLTNLLNPEALQNSYLEEWKLCDQHVNDFYSLLADYIVCDHSWMTTLFKDQNFEKSFSDNKCMEMCELKNSNLYNLKQLMMSISSYNIFRNENGEKLENGAMMDPLEVMLQNVLKSIGNKLDDGNAPACIDEELRSIEFQFLWRYFVHILSN